MDSERRCWDGMCGVYVRVENGPLVLQSATVCWMLGQEAGDFVHAAAYAEGADGSPLHLLFEEAEKGFVLKIGR